MWPTEAENREVQLSARAHESTEPVAPLWRWDPTRQLFLTDDDRVWIPESAVELQQRLCVIAHAGASGHRGARTTAIALEELFRGRRYAQTCQRL